MIKYKTFYEKRAYLFYLGLIVSLLSLFICFVDIFVFGAEVEGHIVLLAAAPFGIFSFVYYKYKCIRRKRIYKVGKKYPAKIVSAEEQVSHRVKNTYYLTIEFFVDGVKKTIITDGYIGNPNEYLKSVNCAVYDLNNRYEEGDFQVSDKKRENQNIIRLCEFNPYKLRKKKK